MLVSVLDLVYCLGKKVFQDRRSRISYGTSCWYHEEHIINENYAYWCRLISADPLSAFCTSAGSLCSNTGNSSIFDRKIREVLVLVLADKMKQALKIS